MTRDVLIVLNPRRIAECIPAIGELPIDRLWLSNMTEREIQDHWGQILPHLDRYERAFIISDDACPRPHALKLLRGLMDDGHPVVTGYCNLAADDFRANLTYTPLRIPISTRSYGEQIKGIRGGGRPPLCGDEMQIAAGGGKVIMTEQFLECD